MHGWMDNPFPVRCRLKWRFRSPDVIVRTTLDNEYFWVGAATRHSSSWRVSSQTDSCRWSREPRRQSRQVDRLINRSRCGDRRLSLVIAGVHWERISDWTMTSSQVRDTAMWRIVVRTIGRIRDPDNRALLDWGWMNYYSSPGSSGQSICRILYS